MAHDVTIHLHVAAWVIPFVLGMVTATVIGGFLVVWIANHLPPIHL